MDDLVTGGCGYIGSALVPALCTDPAVDRVVLDSLAETGFEPEWILEDDVADLARQFSEGAHA